MPKSNDTKVSIAVLSTKIDDLIAEVSGIKNHLDVCGEKLDDIKTKVVLSNTCLTNHLAHHEKQEANAKWVTTTIIASAGLIAAIITVILKLFGV
jgi:hypothetical protein